MSDGAASGEVDSLRDGLEEASDLLDTCDEENWRALVNLARSVIRNALERSQHDDYLGSEAD